MADNETSGNLQLQKLRNSSCQYSKEDSLSSNTAYVQGRRFFYDDSAAFKWKYCRRYETSNDFSSFFANVWHDFPHETQPELFFTASDEERFTTNVLSYSSDSSEEDEERALYLRLSAQIKKSAKPKINASSWQSSIPGYSTFEFPNKKSILSQEQMEECFEIVKLVSTFQNLSEKQCEKFRMYKTRIETEQQVFLQMAQTWWRRNFHLRHKEILPQVETFVNSLWQEKLYEVRREPKFYTNLATIPLCPQTEEPVEMQFVSYLYGMGKGPPCFIPFLYRYKITLNSFTDDICQEYRNNKKQCIEKHMEESAEKYHPAVSQDRIGEELALQHNANVVMSAAAFCSLVDNHPPFVNHWHIPFTVKEYKAGQKKKVIIYFDKPLAPQAMSQYDRKEKYLKIAANRSFSQFRVGVQRFPPKGVKPPAGMDCPSKPNKAIPCNSLLNYCSEKIKEKPLAIQKDENTCEGKSLEETLSVDSVQEVCNKNVEEGLQENFRVDDDTEEHTSFDTDDEMVIADVSSPGDDNRNSFCQFSEESGLLIAPGAEESSLRKISIHSRNSFDEVQIPHTNSSKIGSIAKCTEEMSEEINITPSSPQSSVIRSATEGLARAKKQQTTQLVKDWNRPESSLSYFGCSIEDIEDDDYFSQELVEENLPPPFKEYTSNYFISENEDIIATRCNQELQHAVNNQLTIQESAKDSEMVSIDCHVESLFAPSVRECGGSRIAEDNEVTKAINVGDVHYPATSAVEKESIQVTEEPQHQLSLTTKVYRRKRNLTNKAGRSSVSHEISSLRRHDHSDVSGNGMQLPELDNVSGIDLQLPVSEVSVKEEIPTPGSQDEMKGKDQSSSTKANNGDTSRTCGNENEGLFLSHCIKEEMSPLEEKKMLQEYIKMEEPSTPFRNLKCKIEGIPVIEGVVKLDPEDCSPHQLVADIKRMLDLNSISYGSSHSSVRNGNETEKNVQASSSTERSENSVMRPKSGSELDSPVIPKITNKYSLLSPSYFSSDNCLSEKNFDKIMTQRNATGSSQNSQKPVEEDNLKQMSNQPVTRLSKTTEISLSIPTQVSNPTSQTFISPESPPIADQGQLIGVQTVKSYSQSRKLTHPSKNIVPQNQESPLFGSYHPLERNSSNKSPPGNKVLEVPPVHSPLCNDLSQSAIAESNIPEPSQGITSSLCSSSRTAATSYSLECPPLKTNASKKPAKMVGNSIPQGSNLPGKATSRKSDINKHKKKNSKNLAVLPQWDNVTESTTHKDNDDFESLLAAYSKKRSNKDWLESSAQDFSNQRVTYNLWKLHKSVPSILSKKFSNDINLLIRCKEGHRKRNGRLVKIAVKTEYQNELGAEQVTLSEVTRQWASVIIRPQTNLLRVRVNAVDSEVIQVQELSAAMLAREAMRLHNVKLGDRLASIQAVLERVVSGNLPPGRYLLSHKDPAFATIHCPTDTSSFSLSLHNQFPWDANTVGPERRPWVPLDTQTLTPKLLKTKRVPVMFKPPKKLSTPLQRSALRSLGLGEDGEVFMPKKVKKSKKRKTLPDGKTKKRLRLTKKNISASPT